jgi:hypothetical protein
VNRKRNANSRVAKLNRLRLVESLESRACCSADEALMTISLESAESTQSFSSVESILDAKNFVAQMETAEAGLEQPVVHEEASEAIMNASAIDEAQQVDLEDKPLEPLGAELSSTEAVIAILNGNDPKDTGKRISRLSTRSRIATTPRVTLEDIDFTLRSTASVLELGRQVETKEVRVSELPTTEAVKAVKTIRIVPGNMPGNMPGNELGTATPHEPSKPQSQRGNPTVRALVAGLILLPLRTGDWQAEVRQVAAFGWRKTMTMHQDNN